MMDDVRLVERLERLERANAVLLRRLDELRSGTAGATAQRRTPARRWLGACALALLVAAVGLVAVGAAAAPGVVDVERLVLRDAAGKVRAELAVNPRGRAEFFLHDRKEQKRLGLFVADSGEAALVAFDRDGRDRVVLSNFPSLRLNGRDHQERLGLTVTPTGNPAISFWDNKGTSRMRLWVDDDGSPALMTFDKQGKRAFQAPGH